MIQYTTVIGRRKEFTMNKAKIIGAILALSLAIVPATNLVSKTNFTTPITASAATAGVYYTNQITHDYNPSNYNSSMGAYMAISLPSNQISLSKGTYVYSTGLEAMAPVYGSSKYYESYLYISVQGKGYWVPKRCMNFYR